jgi:hypothetical protein
MPVAILRKLDLNQGVVVVAVASEVYSQRLAAALRFCHAQRHPPSHSPSFGLCSDLLPSWSLQDSVEDSCSKESFN